MAQPYMVIPAQGSDQADEWVRLGVEAQLAGRLPDAQQKYQQALRLDPRHAVATQNLAIVFAQTPGLLNEALLTIERAAMMDGVHAVIPMNHALMALESERVDEALANARRAAEMAPLDPATLWALAMAEATAGNPAAAVPLYNRMLDIDPKHGAAGPNACFTQTLTNAGPADLLRQRRRWYDANRYAGKVEKHTNDRNADRPLRVGYVGGDFKSHSAAFIFGRVLLHHSASVEMYLYSSLPVNPEADGKTKAFQAACGDRWRDISAMNDDDAAAMVRRDRIDILVDLAAHTNGGRLALFTRKPAPVQVTAWGFAHGTGLPEIDYFFADPIAVPEPERQHYAEKIVDLPCIVTMEEPKDYNLKAYSAPPLKKNGFVTFGSYARYEKMSDDCLLTFAEIMRRVPDSRMQFKDNAYRRPFSIRRILKLMNQCRVCVTRGTSVSDCSLCAGSAMVKPDSPEFIAPERLLFSIATSHPDHMLSYCQCDIALDPWPHSGGVVAMEQLYMGVPLLTKYGTQPAGRSATSILAAMGRQDWIASTPAEYVEKAVAMAENPKAMAEARKTLRGELMASPVVAGYVEKVEEAYKTIFRKWCES